MVRGSLRVQRTIYISCKVSFLGTQLLIYPLNSSRNLNFFISAGTSSYSFGPIKDVVSMPFLSVYGMLQLYLNWLLRSNSKISSINSGAIKVLTLFISVINFCRFGWFKVLKLFLLGSSSKHESISVYANCKALL